MDGTVLGRSDRIEHWFEDVDPALAARTYSIHVMHFWSPRYDSLGNLVAEAVRVGTPLLELISEVKMSGGDGK